MPWPVPTPDDIAARQAAAQVAAFALQGDDVDAVSASAPLGVINRSTAGSIFGVHVEQARLAQELMPDTAQDWLSRHGAIWGVPQEQPTQAAGKLLLTGKLLTPIPIGTIFTTSAGLQVSVTTATTLGAGTTSVPVQAVLAGSAGNIAAGVTLAIGSPISGLSPQTGTVDASGITGGQDLESNDSWRARILARIRNPPAGGAAADYEAWATAIAPGAIVAVKPGWVGAGTVGVIVALPGPAVIDGTTLAAIDTSIQALRPVTAQVSVLAASLKPIDFTLHLNPDTSATRAAALAALQLQFATDAAIGGTVYLSRLDAALANADGEFSHERTLPAADVVLAAAEVASLGTVTWV